MKTTFVTEAHLVMINIYCFILIINSINNDISYVNNYIKYHNFDDDNNYNEIDNNNNKNNNNNNNNRKCMSTSYHAMNLVVCTND